MDERERALAERARVRRAFEAGRCPDCGGVLEADTGYWPGRRECRRRRVWWGPQFRDWDGRPKPGTLIYPLRLIR